MVVFFCIVDKKYHLEMVPSHKHCVLSTFQSSVKNKKLLTKSLSGGIRTHARAVEVFHSNYFQSVYKPVLKSEPVS